MLPWCASGCRWPVMPGGSCHSASVAPGADPVGRRLADPPCAGDAGDPLVTRLLARGVPHPRLPASDAVDTNEQDVDHGPEVALRMPARVEGSEAAKEWEVVALPPEQLSALPLAPNNRFLGHMTPGCLETDHDRRPRFIASLA